MIFQKKFINFYLLIFSLFFIFLYPNFSLASSIVTPFSSSSTNSFVVNDISNLKINSKNYIVFDRLSNTTILGKDPYTKVKMASTTKIMTAILVIENANLDELVTISKNASSVGGSELGIKTNDKVSIHDLLYGLMLSSGNDAAIALAEAISGNVPDFLVLMNTKAKSLNLVNTNFESPHGLDSENHFSTAYDLALLADYALENDIFSKIVGTKTYTVYINGYPKTLSNTNELLGNFSGIYGVKTGFTNGANRCLVTSCKQNNMDLICVVLGADTKNDRTNDTKDLYEYVFSNYSYFDLEEYVIRNLNLWKSNNIDNIDLIKSQTSNIDICVQDTYLHTIPIHTLDTNNISSNINFDLLINTPIFKNQILGNLKINISDNIIYNLNILNSTDIYKKDTYSYITEFFINFPKYITSILK